MRHPVLQHGGITCLDIASTEDIMKFVDPEKAGNDLGKQITAQLTAV
jgi:hypothetical protein